MKNRVKIFRKQKGWSLYELSLRSGVQPQTIRNIERFKNTNLIFALKIAKALDMKANELYFL